ncbi:MAG: Ig-like domain-containing protein [Anaerolineales bacterium]
MRSSHFPYGKNNKSSIFILISTLILISLAWSLGGCKKKTPTPTITPTLPPATPTPLPQTLPPALVETDPLPGAQLALKNPITFYFNQAMQHASVEAAVMGEPALSGSFAWRDDSTLTFTPDTSLLPDTSLTINIATTAQSSKGMALLQPISLSYTTSGYLRLVQSLPAANTNDVNPTSAVVAAFNQPVVPLGADPGSLPAGFTLTPSADGRGEWINTSTYIFYPQPALAGGASYQVSINPDLTSTTGSSLESAPSWSFDTVLPRLVSATPADNTNNVRLDTNVQLNFSYSMDSTSVETNFSLQTSAGDPVSGQSAWNEDFTTFTFTPTALLQRDVSYSVLLGTQAAALGGTPLGEPTQLTWHTVPELTIYGSEPSEGGVQANYGGFQLFLSSLVNTDHIEDFVTFNPPVANMGAWMEESQMTLSFYGNYDPDTNYIVTVSPDLTDLWGSRLGQAYTVHFRTASLDPILQFPYNPDSSFLTTQDKGILAQVTNLSSIPITMGTLTLNDLLQMYGNNGYDYRQNFNPRDAQSWTFHPDVPPNHSTTVTIPVSADGQPRSPGLYYMRLDLPNNYGYVTSMILAVSHYQATLKLSPTEAFLWAVDLNTDTPAADLPVTIYDQSGIMLATGTTDVSGVFQSPITVTQDPYTNSFAILGQPGEDNFGFAMTNWDDGVTPGNFDILADYYPANVHAYAYTDRPIYRPGDTVYFRLIVRQVSNGRYTQPDISSYPLVLYGSTGEQIASFDLPLSAFATAHGEYTLPSDAQPGTYSLTNPDNYLSLLFQVADYRKPEINLQVSFESTDVLSGTALVADVNARYFFDAPAGNLPLHWALYRQDAYFNIPNYQVGPVDTSWLDVFNYNFGSGGLGVPVTDGDAQTDANGKVTVKIPPPAESGRQQYTLEVTLTDESGSPVSARSSIYVNPAEYYIGVHPDAWSYQADSEAGFNVLVADWNGDPAGERALTAQFQRVVWVRQDPSPDTLGYVFPTYVAEYTPIDSASLKTAKDGTGRLKFTPPEPGTYQLDVSGDGTLTQVIIWVGGAGQGVWPSLPNQRLRLVADRDSYKPGDTAQVFIPSPFGSAALGLLTIERGNVMRYQILHLEPGGSTIPLALNAEDAPNVYIAVTLLGQDDQGYPDFRQGYVNLPVDPSFEYLNVTLTSQPERTGPGESVTFTMRIMDKSGSPVEGEFSLSVVDLAVLTLAEPNATDIFSAFYGQQSLNVRTGISLAASGQRLRYMPGGMGGGGGEAPESVTRENFPDTAYWDAQIVTDANGAAAVTLSLPDSLTTWQVLVRGLTKNTLVGEAQLQVITTKDLLIRPVTPRFLVVGDHAMLAAVVQNNTPNAVQGTASLQATGFTLDDPNSLTQQVTVPPNGRTRLEWWGTAEDVASASLRFSVQAGDLQDAVLVSRGAMPVLRYTAPQTFATSGTLADEGQRLELVSLPVTFDANSGSLNVELDPSLAAAMLDALDALENYPYDCTEQILSRFLPNLVTYTTLQTFGIDSPDLKARLDRTLNQGLEHLLTLQNADGGWGWWQGVDSDAYITAYVLYGLASARDASIAVPEETITKAVSYISSVMITPSQTTEAWELDRLAFENFTLTTARTGNLASANRLNEVRDQLSPWAKGFLAITLNSFSPDGQQVQTLISDLQATAIRSATGVHWEAANPDWRNMTSTLSNTAMVVYTLAQLEPASTVIPDAVNYLMSNRQATGFWSSSYESAWILLSMDEVMNGTGELGSNYNFGASLNGTQIATGQAGGETQLNPVVTSLPISVLYPHDPNALIIQRDPGTGRLYYTAALNIYRPVEDIAPLDRGISVSRAYFTLGSDLKTAIPINTTQVGDMLTVRLTIILPNDAYHFAVEDYIPAGSEILNTSLKTSQLGVTGEPGPLYDPRDPFSQGWGWWLFNPAQIYDDHISWTASYLPAGTYELTYTLTILQAGEYHLLPARAWMFYFPEVQGNSAGGILEIKP